LESLEREPDCRSRRIGQLNWLWKGVLLGVHGQHGAIRFQHYGLPESEKIEKWTS
jgi:hypothetical protein